jgi:hypothetical protein
MCNKKNKTMRYANKLLLPPYNVYTPSSPFFSVFVERGITLPATVI